MPEAILHPPLDSRVSGLDPERHELTKPELAGTRPPTAGLRIIGADESDEEHFEHVKLVIAGYVKRHGKAKVQAALDLVAGGAR